MNCRPHNNHFHLICGSQQANNNSLRLKNQTLSATLQNLETENEQHQTTINTMRSCVGDLQRARAVAQKLLNIPTTAPAPTATTAATYQPISKKPESREGSKFHDPDEDCMPERVSGRVPMPHNVSENVINTALENCRRRSHVSNPCEAFQQSKVPCKISST